MYLTHLHLEEFRCFHRLDLSLPPEGIRLIGHNGAGKTSVLEALYVLATFRSFRTSTERQLIHRDSGRDLGVQPYARLVAQLLTEEGDRQTLEVTITIDEDSGTARKRAKIDGTPRRATDAVGTLRVVLFSPEDLDLVLGSPSLRRRYLDITLSQIDRLYLQALSRYHRILEQRNSLLKHLATHGNNSRTLAEQLAFWDEQLVVHGSYIIATRIQYIAQLSRAAQRAFRALSRNQQEFSLRYHASLPLPPPVLEQLSVLDREDAQATLSPRYSAFLQQMRADELRRGVTLAGPHRDDLQFLLAGEPLADYGSRGIQRLAVVATKLAEIELVFAATQEYPVLLLDDVLSELDPINQNTLLEALAPLPAQRIITAVSSAALNHPALAALPCWTVTVDAASSPHLIQDVVDMR
ncbi:DNA replication/repair protein RecF [Thermorudis peleae]|uniref:DNA replication/repair protein RecF n=1 Tax=Thermorudis peleae TaxID=1382356 RepID=UPI00068D7EAA|nr:DNA replication/repair protein RecF [Thermorudis peleae]